jgi:hypothetical protein
MTDCSDSTGFQSSLRIFLPTDQIVRSPGYMRRCESLQADVSFKVKVRVVDLRHDQRKLEHAKGKRRASVPFSCSGLLEPGAGSLAR